MLTRAKERVRDSLRGALVRLGYEVSRAEPDSSEGVFVHNILELRDIDLVLDVGANRGRYVKALRRYGYKGNVVSFEPITAMHDLLTAESEGDANWQVAPRMALGDSHGEITIHVSANFVSSSVLSILPAHEEAAPRSRYVSEEQTPLRRLDDAAKSYVSTAKNVFLKIDVQGFEKQVLAGSEGILPKVSAMQLELSLVPLYDNPRALMAEMIESVKSLGFELYAFFPGFVDPRTGRMLQVEGIFCRPAQTQGRSNLA